MSNSASAKCPRCGTPLPPEAEEGMCPACLLSGALKPQGEATAVLAPEDHPVRPAPETFPRAFGSYRLHGLLGRGGMGTVYEAEEVATARRVALKRLGQRLDSPDMRKRFVREGRLAAGVRHPNSLYVYGAEEIEGVPVITMELTAGGTLQDELKQRGPLPSAEAVDAILDVIAGLEAALEAGVLHRDIKPSNCFVGADGSVKVGDYGLSVSTLARDDSYATATGVIMGTPAYAAPEQLRGDPLDVRADIYAVGATLFTLLTGRPPFEGANAVQVVANAVNQKPPALAEFRDGLPPGLERILQRCLAKAPEGRYPDYATLRNALLPFSSREPEPASMKRRASGGWMDFLLAFLPAYVVLMFTVGALDLLVRPVMDRTLYSARYYLLLLGVGILFFTLAEGIWGGGPGKRLKGLRVMRNHGRRPGLVRACIRISMLIFSIEVVRWPLLMATLPRTEWSGLQHVWFILATNLCCWIPVLLTLGARLENGFRTLYDRASGTRVVVKPTGILRPAVPAPARPEEPAEDAPRWGPYLLLGELAPDRWMLAADPVLRRKVWLVRRAGEAPSAARRQVARAGRTRWLQKVEQDGAVCDAFEAAPGLPFATFVQDGRHVAWGTLRHWLEDLATEMWDATGDGTLPDELSLDHVWISTDGRALLLDEPWPDVAEPAGRIRVGDMAGRQRFLHAVAACVDATGLPVHARPVLRNLEAGKFEKLSFLAGTLRGMLNRPAEVSRGIRAASIFVIPGYTWVMCFVGYYHETRWYERLDDRMALSALVVLGFVAVAQFLALPFHTSVGQATFRLAVVNTQGEPATTAHLLARWAVAWLPLAGPILALAVPIVRENAAAIALAQAILLAWLGAAAYAVIHPHQGVHDRLARTWVVRR